MNTLTSKNVSSNLPPQKPLAFMSSRLPSCSLPVSGSSGSTSTSAHISLKMFATTSRISLCRIVGMAPVGQLRACAVSKEAPQQHVLGNLSAFQPYRMHNPSRNSFLDRLKPCSLTGKASNHVEAPFSCANSMQRWRVAGRIWRM